MPKNQNEGKNGPDVVIIILTEDGQEVEVTVKDPKGTSKEPQNQDRDE